MAGIKIEGGSSTAGSPNVDANYNLNVVTPATKTLAGFVASTYEQDAGSITGTRYLRSPAVSEDNRLNVGLDTSSGTYNFNATTQNTGDFKHVFATMTMTQSGGFLNINPAGATASGNHAYLQTWKHFTLPADAGIQMEMIGQITAMPSANQVFDAGMFLGTAGTAPADGAWFRLTAAGLIGVTRNNGGTEAVTGTIAATLPLNTNGKYRIVATQRETEFWVSDANGDMIKGGGIATPAGYSIPYSTVALPMCFQMYNTGVASAGCIVKIGSAHVSMLDLNYNKPWAHQMATQGDAYQGQDGGTMGSLAIYNNSALTAAAALANATAAANFVGLGGAALVLPTLTAGTDGILFSYLNPAGGVSQPPRTLVVTGVTVSGAVQVVLAGGPLVYVMGIAYGHNALSLATAETGSFVTATTKAPRRIVLGHLSCVVTAAVSTTLGIITIKFDSPIVVNPGEYFAITARNVATVTTTGAVAFTASVDHYLE